MDDSRSFPLETTVAGRALGLLTLIVRYCASASLSEPSKVFSQFGPIFYPLKSNHQHQQVMWVGCRQRAGAGDAIPTLSFFFIRYVSSILFDRNTYDQSYVCVFSYKKLVFLGIYSAIFPTPRHPFPTLGHPLNPPKSHLLSMPRRTAAALPVRIPA